MIPTEITCPRCGWRNEASARMCGGCGMPLSLNDMTNPPSADGATVYVPDTPKLYSTGPDASINETQPTPPTSLGMGGAYSPLSPATPITPMTPVTPRRTAPTPAYTPVPSSPTDPSLRAITGDGVPAALPSRRARSGSAAGFWGRFLLIVVLVLIVLGGLGYGAWGLYVTPSLHTSVDTELYGRLKTLVKTSFQTASGTYTLTASQATDGLGPSDSSQWVQNLKIQFSPNVTYLEFNFFGDGNVSTELFAENGSFHAAGTIVNGSLSLFESGRQMEATINRALATFPQSAYVVQMKTLSGELTYTIR